ncbi:DNA repair protein RecN [Paenibacillus sp. y28]|uniref:DNA repair protein RecN n=1 Tax=Paenibacillus sp. y28 TaxID=3129110 RepID=UPI00301B07A4
MLAELTIRNLAVVENTQLHCNKGFHVLTGETGAGKSIIIDALSLIAGARGSAELVRYGCEKAEMEAMFELPKEHPVWAVMEKLGFVCEDGIIIIRREITAQGKSTSRINGQLVNLASLRDVGECLVNIHGQHEHQSLLKVDRHLQWLDAFGEGSISAVKARYQAAYDRFMALRREMRALEDKSKQALQMADLYRFQIEELKNAELKAGEDELLLEEKRKLGNAEKMFQNSADAYEQLYGNSKGISAIAKAIAKIEEITAHDKNALQPLLEQMQSAYYQLEDAAFQLRDYRDSIEFNPGRLEFIERRLDLISGLRRKYGDSVQDMLDYLHKIENELSLIENSDETLREMQAEAERQQLLLKDLGGQLSQLRRAAADQLAQLIEQELKGLHMERTRFYVQMESTGDKFTRDGLDQVEFLISPNPGEPLRPLHKIASGGELSRIMLGMKSIFARIDRIPVLVFDEVDTGVSGRAAQAIAVKLSHLSRHVQVFSITHLPQVACMADVHFEIRKAVDGERTFTRVEHLQETVRVEELARMLGGVEVTSTTLHHAEEMLQLASQKKQELAAS